MDGAYRLTEYYISEIQNQEDKSAYARSVLESLLKSLFLGIAI